MVLFDSSLPPPAVPGALVLRFPKRSLRLAPQRVTQLLAVPFPAWTGCGRLLSQLLTGIADEYAHCSPPELIQLGQTALDLTTVILGRHTHQDPELPSESRRRILYLRIATFVDRYLGDPALRDVPVHAIGARWGFPRASDFNRAFKTTVGMSPGRYRESAGR